MGVEKEVLRPGTGPKPVPGQNVTVHCTGYGKNGDLSQKFWSTKDPGQEPFSFKIGQGSVIKGWDEGVLGMQLGEVARLRVIINLCATFTISNFYIFVHQMESESILKFNGVIFGKLPLWDMVSSLACFTCLSFLGNEHYELSHRLRLY
ncbi:peptidyl-prolyl cis-trans isomerase FKBP12 isoform X1 [Quercus robur]|uniref:peptidyl-prolyl cis-trans isomerase FKBP12 isoform X1 n=1 Tax=Quercus robur TaxID=38942 RepID=UPI002162D8AF|nr:peptidyl-prolyl cis-trans isomerase FKBP12 isoform X1 [Quercus robur]